MGYRGSASSASFVLRLNDAVRLPGAQALHLTRPDGQGTMGRGSVRYDVHLPARVGAINALETGLFFPCTVLDISAGGLRLEAATQFQLDDFLQLELPLNDGVRTPLVVRAGVRWCGPAENGKQAMALRFRDLSHSADMRLRGYFQTLELES